MATKEKMAFGGAMPMRGRAPAVGATDPRMAMARPRVSMPMRPPMAAPMEAPMRPQMGAQMSAPVMKKGGKAMKMAKGGEMESKSDQRKEEKMDMSQDKAMIKKAFKQHDSQEHKGDKGTSLKLKRGGKMATGGVISPGYKKGGMPMVMKDGKKVPSFMEKKMATGGVMTPGYKDGGHVKYRTTCSDGGSGHTMQNKKIAKEGYGHSEIDCNPMKSGGAATKISTQMKKGGACNY
jgi:hypothetical protein